MKGVFDMKKIGIIIVIIFASTILFTSNAAAVSTIRINGTDLSWDANPLKINDRMIVPIRPIMEALGANVEWGNDAQTITATKNTFSIKLEIGSFIASKNGENIILDAAPELIDDKAYVPLRFVSEALGAEVNWNEATQNVDINTTSVTNKSTNSAQIDTIAYTNGKYTGEIKNGVENGKGTFVWSNGDKYVGDWVNGKRHGQGTMTWANGDKYTGEYKNDLFDGQGTYITANKTIYTGSFSKGKCHGYGKITFPDGSGFAGTWNHGEPISNGTSSGGTTISPRPTIPSHSSSELPDMPVYVVPDSNQETTASQDYKKEALDAALGAIETQYDYDLKVLNNRNEAEKDELIRDLISRGFSGYPQAQVDQIDARYNSLREQLLNKKNQDIESARAMYR